MAFPTQKLHCSTQQHPWHPGSLQGSSWIPPQLSNTQRFHLLVAPFNKLPQICTTGVFLEIQQNWRKNLFSLSHAPSTMTAIPPPLRACADPSAAASQTFLSQGSYQCIPLPTEPMDPSQAENTGKGAEHPAHPIASPRHPWGVFTSNPPCLASQPEPRLSSQHINCKLHLKLQLKGLRVLNHQTCRQQLNTH